MKSSLSVEIAAPPDLVFRLANDPLRWPTFLPHYVVARPLTRDGDGLVAEYVARRPLLPVLGLGLPVAWRSRHQSDPAARMLRFHHLGGASGGMDVVWRVEPGEKGARVTIEHEFRARLPGWATFVDRLFVRPIATRTLATFRTLAEAVAPIATESNAPAPTKRRS